MKKLKPKKEPSLLRKVVDIYWERHKISMARRELERNSWSLDFLVTALSKAAELEGTVLEMEIEDKNGRKMRIRSVDISKEENDSIFNHLDDDVAVHDFIARNSVR